MEHVSPVLTTGLKRDGEVRSGRASCQAIGRNRNASMSRQSFSCVRAENCDWTRNTGSVCGCVMDSEASGVVVSTRSASTFRRSSCDVLVDKCAKLERVWTVPAVRYLVPRDVKLARTQRLGSI